MVRMTPMNDPQVYPKTKIPSYQWKFTILLASENEIGTVNHFMSNIKNRLILISTDQKNDTLSTSSREYRERMEVPHILVSCF